jgi:hypothetical protein
VAAEGAGTLGTIQGAPTAPGIVACYHRHDDSQTACRMGGGGGDTPSCFLSSVQSTINGIIAAQPTWFAWDEVHGCWTILELDLFLDAVVADLGTQGLCALRDPNAPGEEITVKRNNDLAESFDIVASNGCARTGVGSYTGLCSPAWW